jgi:hypothetical protein
MVVRGPNAWLRVPALVTVVVAAALVAPGPVLAATSPRPLVTVPGRTVEVDVDAPAVAERVALAVAPGVRSSQLRVRVARVARGSVRRDDYLTAFAAGFVPAHVQPDGLLLKITTRSLKPGTYAVALRVWLKGARQSRRVTRIALTVVLRPARLVVPATITIRRTRAVRPLGLGISAEHVDGAPTVRDRSLHTWISRLSATVVEGPSQDGHPARGVVRFTGGSLRPGGNGVVAVDASDLPVGTASGVVGLDAAELDKPLRIPFEIVTAFPDWVIIAIVLLGLTLGTLVRTVFGAFDRRFHTRGAAGWLLKRLKVEKERERDPVLKQAVSDAYDNLLPELKRFNSATAVAAATTLASDARDAAYKEYGERYELTRASLDALRLAVGRHSRVGDVDRRFKAAREALQEARDQLGKRNVTAADAAVARADEALVPGVEDGARAWSEAAWLLVGTIGTTAATLGLPGRDVKVNGVGALIQAVPPVAAADDHAGVGAAIATDAAAAAFEPLVLEAIKAAGDRANATLIALSAKSGLGATKDRRTIREAVKFLGTARFDDRDSIARLNSRLADMGRRMVEIEQRHQLGPQAQLPLAGTVEFALAGAAAGTTGGQALAAGTAAAVQVGVPMTSPIAPTKAAEQPTAFEAPSVSGVLMLLTVGLMRFLILSVVLSLLGYFIFRDGFQGTWSQMINIFVWAFFTDVALSTVQSLQSRLPGAPAPATGTPG